MFKIGRSMGYLENSTVFNEHPAQVQISYAWNSWQLENTSIFNETPRTSTVLASAATRTILTSWLYSKRRLCSSLYLLTLEYVRKRSFFHYRQGSSQLSSILDRK